MSNEAARAERDLAISYALAADRPAVEALLALDDVLAAVLRTTREPLVGQMRLTWWHEALLALDDRAPPAEPVLKALHADVLARDITGADLAPIADGWEALLADPLDDAAMLRMAEERGGRLFVLLGRVMGVELREAAVAGRGWALADLAANIGDPALAKRATALACDAFAGLSIIRWPRRARAMGALIASARMTRSEPGSPLRVGRLLMLRMTGR